jgi:hypothetical protein
MRKSLIPKPGSVPLFRRLAQEYERKETQSQLQEKKKALA